VGIDEIGPIDLYSCFPIAVSMGAEALGLPIDDPARPLTLTGGLTFVAGLATTTSATPSRQWSLRCARPLTHPGSSRASGGTPPSMPSASTAKPPEAGFRVQNAQAEVDALPQCRSDATATGPVAVETYTVTFDRGGRPERAILALRTKDDARTWGNVLDAATLAERDDVRGLRAHRDPRRRRDRGAGLSGCSAQGGEHPVPRQGTWRSRVAGTWCSRPPSTARHHSVRVDDQRQSLATDASATASAVVQGSPPWRFALVTASGPAVRQRLRTKRCFGARTPTVSPVPPSSAPISGRAGRPG